MTTKLVTLDALREVLEDLADRIEEDLVSSGGAAWSVPKRIRQLASQLDERYPEYDPMSVASHLRRQPPAYQLIGGERSPLEGLSECYCGALTTYGECGYCTSSHKDY